VLGSKIIETREALKKAGLKQFKWIYYYPIDATPKGNWIEKSVALADYPVAYTKYGYNETNKIKELTNLTHIPHGFNPDHFFPMPKDEDREKFKDDYFKGKAKGKYIVTNVNRNQPRKDLARTLQIFRLFKNQCPDALLYLHSKEQDVGGSIDELSRNFELIPGEDYITPDNFNEHNGVSLEILNAIYNVSDVVMTTTLGEGWGLSITEAMACGTPVIAPNHTSLTELIEGFGTLVTAGKRLNDWIVLPMDNERLRPLVDIPEYVDKLVYLHNNKDKALELANKALAFVNENLKWEDISNKWLSLFEKAIQVIPVVGRNEPCLLCLKEGKSVKFKKCAEHFS
jgi:glycosyltransferase involved in cell wall biosynthesis